MIYFFENALLYSKLKGIDDAKQQIKDALWPNSSPKSQETNFYKLKKNRTNPSLEVINIFCDKTGCTLENITTNNFIPERNTNINRN